MEIAPLIKETRDNWPQALGLSLAWIFSIALAALLILPLTSKGVALVAGTLCGLVLTCLWISARRLKRCPEGKFGFVIAISVESGDTYPLFERDFLQNLETLLGAGALAENMWVYVVPQFHLLRPLTPQRAIFIREQTRSAFVLHGQLRTRQEGIKRHYLDLSGVVGHSETSDDNKKRLTKEFTELLPKRSIASEGAELPAFELTSSLSSAVAKYIAGIAAYLSGASEYAVALYSHALTLAKPKAEEHEVASKIAERIPIRLSEVAITRAAVVYQSWRETRSPLALKELVTVLSSAPGAAHNFPQWKALTAISTVASAGDDFDQIEALINKLPLNDPAAQMNLAFCDVVRGDLRGATRHYRRAHDLRVELETIEEVMSFFEWFQDFRPQFEAEVNFALGYISYYLLDDMRLAEEFFERFRAARGAKYQDEDKLVDKWLAALTA